MTKFCLYGTIGNAWNPWDEASRLWDEGAISTAELIATARDLFDGDELAEILGDIETIERPLACRG